MSRVGKIPVAIPDAVTIEIDGGNVVVNGPKGSLRKSFSGAISIAQEGKMVNISLLEDTKFARSMWGTVRSIISNMVRGVSIGFEQVVEMVGVGYKASIKGEYINLSLAKSHSTIIKIPESISVVAIDATTLKISCHDNEMLGRFVSLLLKQRPVEPYKGKGIKKSGQYVYRKESKKSK